jgi:hypothetical protein
VESDMGFIAPPTLDDVIDNIMVDIIHDLAEEEPVSLVTLANLESIMEELGRFQG